MHVSLDRQRRDEIRRYALRFCCEDCVHLDREHDRCAHGWPSADHRRARYRDPQVDALVFCKEFELL
jgi:hypothetical protein